MISSSPQQRTRRVAASTAQAPNSPHATESKSELSVASRISSTNPDSPQHVNFPLVACNALWMFSPEVAIPQE